jgi:hypothetical protein
MSLVNRDRIIIGRIEGKELVFKSGKENIWYVVDYAPGNEELQCSAYNFGLQVSEL